jgi:hypothetical protein
MNHLIYGFEYKNGLRKRPHFEEMIKDLTQQPYIQYPDRTARFLRESPFMTVLDGEGLREMEAQESLYLKEQQRQMIIREEAMKSGETIGLFRNLDEQRRQRNNVQHFDISDSQREEFE